MRSVLNAKAGLAIVLVAVLITGLVLIWRAPLHRARTNVTAYFDNTNGLYVGDEVRILGVPVGTITRIEPGPERVKVAFWFDSKYRVPADAAAVILSPSLVTARTIQLTPAYTQGPTMGDNAVIPQERTAVPVEFDDLRVQLEKLTGALQPTTPGGVSTLGAFINTAADNLRGQGPDIRDTITKLSQAFSALGDHSTDIFGTLKNLAVLVSALQSSTDLMKQLNLNIATVTGLLANDPSEISDAVNGLNTAIGDVRSFVAENKDTIGTTGDKLASVTDAVAGSLDDIEQLLHEGPTAFQNFVNIYDPAHSALTGTAAFVNFSNPIQFICSAVEAAARLGAEQSAKLCVQYLAPIIKNRQYNFPPIGLNPFVGVKARPNEVTYSEDWLRPDYIPPQPVVTSAPAEDAAPPLPPEPVSTNPSEGLTGLMTPAGSGS